MTALADPPRTGGDARRPEQTFFADPAIDRLLAVTMALASEVYILRSRVRVLERAQQAAGHDIAAAATPTPAEAAAERADAAAFAAHLLEPALGEQQARGPL
jgi:hypothetical protein